MLCSTRTSYRRPDKADPNVLGQPACPWLVLHRIDHVAGVGTGNVQPHDEISEPESQELADAIVRQAIRLVTAR